MSDTRGLPVNEETPPPCTRGRRSGSTSHAGPAVPTLRRAAARSPGGLGLRRLLTPTTCSRRALLTSWPIRSKLSRKYFTDSPCHEGKTHSSVHFKKLITCFKLKNAISLAPRSKLRLLCRALLPDSVPGGRWPGASLVCSREGPGPGTGAHTRDQFCSGQTRPAAP